MGEPTDGLQRITPMIAYEDGPAAIEWLVRVFGFHEQNRMTEPDGRVSHAELEFAGGRIFLATPTRDYQSPKRHRKTCAAARKWSKVPWVIDGLHVVVDDVDAHFARAKSAGATILSPPEDSPFGRLYRAEDLEGHRWMFMQPR
ncbi:MAG TPA: VOC family protein [Thermoplasmata archaeon]|nr:VOC family protein [Thermoplasmata archaeon]